MSILVVDDNEENLYMLQVLLKGHGYEVDLAVDGEEALKKARENPPQIVISDILMPNMDGFALCRNWKKDQKLKSIPFIVYTATYTDPKDEKFALSLGAERFIVKPAEPDHFMKIITEVLKQQEAGEIRSDGATMEMEESYLREYNQTLIRKLEEKVKDLEQNQRVLEQEIGERRRTEEKLLTSLKEKKSLLQELYHRTFNNMQVIRSLLVLQASGMDNQQVQYFVKSTEDRIQAMALVHQLLHESKSLSKVNMKNYIPALCRSVMESYQFTEERVKLELELPDLLLLIDSSIPLGLILNELLSNSFRHAFPDGRKGKISVHLSGKEGEMIELIYADNGVGNLKDFDPRTSKEMGFKTIFALGEDQLQGEVEIEATEGFKVRLRFNDELYSERI